MRKECVCESRAGAGVRRTRLMAWHKPEPALVWQAVTTYLTVAYGGKQGCVQAQRPGSAARSLKSFGIVQEAGQGALVRAKAVVKSFIFEAGT